MKIKIRKADTLYSLWLRKERKYTCEKCGRKYKEGKGLQVSHFFGRRCESVRFDTENTDILCFSCHQNFEEMPNDYREWKLNRMGDKAYKLLDFRAHQLVKRDDEKIILFLSHKIKN